MIEDARSLADGDTLAADVCVVGAGAAGITLARELEDRDLSVLLLESGGVAYEQETQALYDGEEGGNVLRPRGRYLASSRLRYLGGTTNHWAGWCRPLDAIDFEERPWVAHSGWPFGRDELVPFYFRALEVAGLAPAGEEKAADALPPLGDGRWFESTSFQVHPRRFARVFRRELERSRRIRVVLHANAVGLRSDAGARRVEEVSVACLDGKRLRARARAYVLAAGGIENARLLLVSAEAAPGGLGNGRDLVGRFFMDHPHSRFVAVALTEPALARSFLPSPAEAQAAVPVVPALRPSDAAQRAHRLLNLVLTQPLPLASSAAGDSVAGGEVAWGIDRQGSGGEPAHLVFQSRAEQAPNPESRVLLSPDTDALGVRRVRLEWRLQPEDGRSLRSAARLLGRELGARGLGRVRFKAGPPELAPGHAESAGSRRFRGGSHHMGTTRMHRDPGRGVVDADCRVHGLDNLFVAGSSVFPTGGASNPTLTVLALTLRLGRHLHAALRR